MSSFNFNYLLKFIVIGDSSVGKSNILLRYTQNEFNQEYQSTIGVEFGAKNIKINNKIYRIQIWDTAGQENFRSITRAYYKNSVCALVVYDITKRESFENVQSWIQDCRNQSPKTIIMVLVGNKNDLENERDVSFDEGEQFAKNNNMIFYETSAKTGKNVNEIFENTVNNISKKIEENYYDLENDSCGIKVGMIEGNLYNSINNNNNISLDFDDKKEENYGCC
jgi:Ras-related protein Rab-2A